MKLRASQVMWLSNPTKVLCLNLEDSQRFVGQVTFTEAGIDMASLGWVKLGSVEHCMTIEVMPDELAANAVAALQGKLKEMDAEHEKQRNIFLEAIGKLSAIGYTPRGQA